MIARCAVTEAAARLSLELEAYSIPDDFQPEGKYRQVVARVRDQYTNYRQLLVSLPSCTPADCGKVEGGGCASHDLAEAMLEIEARRLAIGVYACWEARHAANKADKLTLALAE